MSRRRIKNGVVPRVQRFALREKGVQLDLPTRAQLRKGYVRDWTPEDDDDDDIARFFGPFRFCFSSSPRFFFYRREFAHGEFL
jgi:hypothetical protein